jgi:hypothetical protein
VVNAGRVKSRFSDTEMCYVLRFSFATVGSTVVNLTLGFARI